jgi:hypothetical protein
MTIPAECGVDRQVAEDQRDCYWLYVVTDCDAGQASGLFAVTGKMPVPRLELIRGAARLDLARGEENLALPPVREFLDPANVGMGGFTHVWSHSR